MREEIVVAMVMILISIGGSVVTGNDKRWSAFFLFAVAVAGSLCAGMGVRFREIVEGPFGFLDSMLAVASASVLVFLLDYCGAFSYLFSRFARIRSSILKSMAMLFLIALPAMLTGFAASSIHTSGQVVGNALEDKRKAAVVVGTGAFIGVVLPPSCVPAMIAANGAGSVLPTPYNGFFLPLLALGLPAFVVYSILERRTFSLVISQNSEETQKSKVSALILGIVLLAVILDGVLGSVFYFGGNALVFFIASLICIAVCGFQGAIDKVREGLINAVTPISIVFALGSFIEISSMTGVRGLFSLTILPYGTISVMLVLMALSLVLGYFFSIPIPAFLITYAVFPIGWLANPVIVAGCSSALAVIALLSRKGAIMQDVSGVFGLEKPISGSEALKSAGIPAAVVLLVGIFMVLGG